VRPWPGHDPLLLPGRDLAEGDADPAARRRLRARPRRAQAHVEDVVRRDAGARRLVAELGAVAVHAARRAGRARGADRRARRAVAAVPALHARAARAAVAPSDAVGLGRAAARVGHGDETRVLQAGVTVDVTGPAVGAGVQRVAPVGVTDLAGGPGE